MYKDVFKDVGVHSLIVYNYLSQNIVHSFELLFFPLPLLNFMVILLRAILSWCLDFSLSLFSFRFAFRKLDGQVISRTTAALTLNVH